MRALFPSHRGSSAHAARRTSLMSMFSNLAPGVRTLKPCDAAQHAVSQKHACIMRPAANSRASSGCQAVGSQPRQSNATMGTNLPESSAVMARVTCCAASWRDASAQRGRRRRAREAQGTRLGDLHHRDVALRGTGGSVSALRNAATHDCVAAGGARLALDVRPGEHKVRDALRASRRADHASAPRAATAQAHRPCNRVSLAAACLASARQLILFLVADVDALALLVAVALLQLRRAAASQPQRAVRCACVACGCAALRGRARTSRQ